MRMRRVPGGSLPRQIRGHRAPQAGGEADVVAHLLPRAVGQLRLEVRHDRRDVCLVRGEHRRRGEVVGEARHDQAHGAVRRQLPRSSSSACSAAKPLNAGALEALDVPPVRARAAAAARRGPCRPTRPRGSRAPGVTNDLGGRRRRDRGEVLVRVDVRAGRVIDREQTHLIEVDHLLHRLGELERQPAVLRAQLRAGDLDVLVGIRHVALAGRHPVPDDAGSDAVGDELVRACRST